MSVDELADFLATQPMGAMCVVDDAGRLVAVPARVLDGDEDGVQVELAATDLASMFDRRPGCVVADSFQSYDAIRGVIARGSVEREAHLVTLTKPRISTFSFADRALPDGGGSEQR